MSLCVNKIIEGTQYSVTKDLHSCWYKKNDKGVKRAFIVNYG